jgi:hypothetical protein
VTTQRDKTMPPRDGRRSKPQIKGADLEYDQARRIELYQIYGPQEPGPHDKPRTVTRRGRAGPG